MIPCETFVLQHTPDPFEQKWENLAIFKWSGKEWQLTFLQERPLNAQLSRWCKDGIIELSEGEEDKLVHISPSASTFLEKVADRLGKLRYRFIAASEAQGAEYS